MAGPRSDHAARAAARIAGSKWLRRECEARWMATSLDLSRKSGLSTATCRALWLGETSPGSRSLPALAAVLMVREEEIAAQYAGETPPSKRKPEHAPGSIEAVRMGRTRAVPCVSGEFNWRRLEFGAARRG